MQKTNTVKASVKVAEEHVMNLPKIRISNGATNKSVLDLVWKSKPIIDAHSGFRNDTEKSRVFQIITCALRDEIPELMRAAPNHVGEYDGGDDAIRLKIGAVINLKNKSLGVFPSKAMGKTIIRFFGRWLVLLMAIFKGLITPSRQSHNNYCLVYGQYETHYWRKDGLSPFERYVQGNPIDPIKQADATLSQISANAQKHLMTPSTVARFPEAEYLAVLNISWFARIWLIFVHVLGLFKTLLDVLLYPAHLIMLEDRANLPVYHTLSQWKLSPRVVISTSDTRSQPLWMRQLPEGYLHYLHYAITPLYVLHKEEEFPEAAAVEVESFVMAPMKHWVWFQSDADKLKEIYHQKDVVVSGIPSFIAPPSLAKPTSKDADLDIVIFDVTPHVHDHAIVGQQFYYGEYSTAKSIVSDIVEIASELKKEFGISVRVRLKPKRGKGPTHDMRYHEFLEELEQSNPIFAQVEPATDLGNLVHQQTLVIARPYTSLGFVMPAIEVSTVFYDPTLVIVDNCPAIDRLEFVQGKARLNKAIIDHVGVTKT